MQRNIARRDFLAATAAAGAGLLAGGSARAAEFQTKLQGAMIGSPTKADLSKLKAAGFEGIESSDWNVTPEKAAEARETAENLGLKIHSVLFGWANFNSDKPSQVEQDIANVTIALKACRGYGASALLLVPCRTGVGPMPEAWEFDIEFDEKTGHAARVAKGDNAKYEKYIAAQNHAVDASRKAVEKLIPVAEKTGVVIALENVWNNLWSAPKYFAHFVGSFDNPWVRAYFDIGNHVKYAPAEEWIRALGKLTVKYHVKDFKLNPNGHGGQFVHPRDGSVNWPVVRAEIEKIGVDNWMTIEDGGLSLAEFRRRFDLIVAGK
jgi:L-ribulose-5-phosphate 3-epimerase